MHPALVATSFIASPTAWLNTLVGMFVCFSRFRLFKNETGRNMWGIPLWGWILIGLILGLIGAILAVIASRKSAIAKARAANYFEK